MYDLAEFGGAHHVRLYEPHTVSGLELADGSLVALLTITLTWRRVIGFDVKYTDHINLLEALALLTLVQTLCRAKVTQTRVLILIDSSVVKGVLTKGRSSSRRLNNLLRHLLFLCLGGICI